ncbi:hypothetical protein H0H92_014368 [Tricholoma furcatifolium]|nr:hypothetical protein H0H92_014368 [Tricholoma furcatifolium]
MSPAAEAPAIAKYRLRYHAPHTPPYDLCIEKGNALGRAIALEKAASRDAVCAARDLQRFLPSAPGQKHSPGQEEIKAGESVIFASALAEHLYLQARVERAKAELAFIEAEMNATNYPDEQDAKKCVQYFLEAYDRELANSMLSLTRVGYDAYKL